DVLAARAPGLQGALLAAKAAGYSHINIDGMLVETDRCRTPGPTPGVDLWWSGKHANHGGNVQVITVPDGPLRPRPHHMTAFSSQPLARNGSLSTWATKSMIGRATRAATGFLRVRLAPVQAGRSPRPRPSPPGPALRRSPRRPWSGRCGCGRGLGSAGPGRRQ